jgi:hypothetical protein
MMPCDCPASAGCAALAARVRAATAGLPGMWPVGCRLAPRDEMMERRHRRVHAGASRLVALAVEGTVAGRDL